MIGTNIQWWVVTLKCHQMFLTPEGCYCRCKPGSWTDIFNQEERAWVTFFARAWVTFLANLVVLGDGHNLCCFLPDSTAVQHHVDPDRSDLCIPHLTHLCSALVTSKLLMAILTWSFAPGGRKEECFQVTWRVKTTPENISFPFWKGKKALKVSPESLCFSCFLSFALSILAAQALSALRIQWRIDGLNYYFWEYI